MHPDPKYEFNLPPEEQVTKRNRTITTYYAQLYQREPELYKWAGMAAFASFHVREKLKKWKAVEPCDKLVELDIITLAGMEKRNLRV